MSLTTLLSNKRATDRRNDILPEPLDDEEEPEPAQPSMREGAKSSPVVVVVMPQKARPRRRRRRVRVDLEPAAPPKAVAPHYARSTAMRVGYVGVGWGAGGGGARFLQKPGK